MPPEPPWELDDHPAQHGAFTASRPTLALPVRPGRLHWTTRSPVRNDSQSLRHLDTREAIKRTMSSPTHSYDVERSLWMKWRLAGLVTFGILIVLLILFLARGALLPIIISVIVAELLFPMVAFLESRLPGQRRYPQAARLLAIAIIYAVFFALVAAFAYLTFQPIFNEAQEFIQTAPEIYEQAKKTVTTWLDELDRQVPEGVKAQLEHWLRSASGSIGEAALGLFTKTLSGITGTVSLLVGLAIVPFLLFYMLKDKERLVDGVYSILPQGISRHLQNVLTLIHIVIGSYIRAQLISATIVGFLVFLGLVSLDVSFALTLALLAGVLGLIPIIGAYIGAVPGLLVVLATDPGKLVWVVLLYLAVQLVENNIVSPRVQGRALRLHPIFIMGTLIIASEIAGLWGVFVGVPLVAAAKDVFAYFYAEWADRGVTETALEGVEEPELPDVAAEESPS